MGAKTPRDRGQVFSLIFPCLQEDGGMPVGIQVLAASWRVLFLWGLDHTQQPGKDVCMDTCAVDGVCVRKTPEPAEGHRQASGRAGGLPLLCEHHAQWPGGSRHLCQCRPTWRALTLLNLHSQACSSISCQLCRWPWVTWEPLLQRRRDWAPGLLSDEVPPLEMARAPRSCVL